MLFGENGVWLDNPKLNDAAVATLMRDKSKEHTIYPAILFAMLSLGIVFISSREAPDLILIGGLLIALIGVLAANAANFLVKATDEGDLPINWNATPRHRHFSGALVLVALGLFILLFVGASYLGPHTGELKLTDAIGGVVLVSIAVLFGILIVLPVIAASGAWEWVSENIGGVTFTTSVFGRCLGFIAVIFSKIDSWLVYGIAPALGAGLTDWRGRYAILALFLIPSCLLTWYLPPLFGLLPTTWSFIGILSVGRRWAWIEDDRQHLRSNPTADTSMLRIGTKQDLRDEALISLLAFVFMLPLAMRQLHFLLGAQGFGFEAGSNADDVWLWFTFFGVELAKAVPFVDWVDIYGAEAASKISNTTAAASHVVFAARAIVDLVILASLIQAVSLSFNLMTHRRSFFAREISVLDPILEKQEFFRAVKKAGHSGWEVRLPQLMRLSHYDRSRIAQIRMKHESTHFMHIVATAIRDQSEANSTASELFMEAIYSHNINLSNVWKSYDIMIKEYDIGIDILRSAHERLSKLPEFFDFRQVLISQAIDLPPSQERISFLRNVLVGTTSDARRENRLLTVEPLRISAYHDTLSSRALMKAQSKDGAKLVREAATEALKSIQKSKKILEPTD